jgi:hypothetical protein
VEGKTDFSHQELNLEMVKHNLLQYVVGSFIFATLLAISFGFTFFYLLNFSEKKVRLNSLKTNNFKQNLTKNSRKFIIFADLKFNSRNRDIMKKFTEYKQLNLNAVADNVAEFWKTNETFKNPWKHAKENLSMFFMKDRLLQTECREFTT